MVALGLLGLGRKCLCLSKTGWNEVDGRLSWSRKDDLPPISHNCQAWTWAAVERGGRAQSQERAGSAEKPWGPVLWGELRSRGQVSRQFLQAKAWWPETRQSVRTDLNPWGTSTQQALAVAPVFGACACKPWAQAGSQMSVFKARVDSCERAYTSPSKWILGNITLER